MGVYHFASRTRATMLAHRRRRWANIEPTLDDRLVFVGYLSEEFFYEPASPPVV